MKFCTPLLLFAVIGFCKAQSIVNGYARVSAISNASVLTVTGANVANHNFVTGEKVIVMQMQDDVIGANTTNAATFGNLSSIANAGKYEIRDISGRSPATGTPTQITVSPALVSSFNTGANSAVQIITFRNLGASYTTTNNITAASWDGSIGGVIAFEVTNTLTLNHSISASGLGFRGGQESANADETCANTVYITSSNLKAYKGEGIYKNTNANYTNGRGKILNGGGGGSQNNTGGGGGGNYTSGGNGGLGWNCTTTNSGYGLAGITLSSSIASDRVFMGGGGGGGQGNNSVATDGGNGGGIILIKAGLLLSNSTCTAPLQIISSGLNAVNSGNDGAGGGGAGGSIILQVSAYSISASCPLTVAASGGNGGSVNNGGSHGGGGGGGQGAILFSPSQPTANVTTQANNGNGGLNSTNPANGGGSSGGGVSGGGVLTPANTPLPVELLYFSGERQGQVVILTWATATENDNSHFVVQRSVDGLTFLDKGIVPGNNNSYRKQEYRFTDDSPPAQTAYYRLKQMDHDNSYHYSQLIAVKGINEFQLIIFPNPFAAGEKLRFRVSGSGNLQLYYSLTRPDGRLIGSGKMNAETGLYENFEEGLFPDAGIYFLLITDGQQKIVQKILVK